MNNASYIAAVLWFPAYNTPLWTLILKSIFEDNKLFHLKVILYYRF